MIFGWTRRVKPRLSRLWSGLAAFRLPFAIVLVFVSGPLLLLLLEKMYSVDWPVLSDIGQSFTGLATLLSAAGLMAVALSIRMQAREMRLSHEITLHNSQRDLIKMALDDSDYLACIGFYGRPQGEGKEVAYNTLWLRYYELAYATTNLSAGRLRYVLRHERFPNASVRRHWELVRHIWGDANDPEFVRLVEEAYRASIEDARSHPQEADVTRSRRRSIWWWRNR